MTLTQIQKSILHYADLFSGTISNDWAKNSGYKLRSLRGLASNGYLAEHYSSFSLTEKGWTEVRKMAAAQHGVQPTAPVTKRKRRSATSRKSSTVRGG
jgi:hypothetical protein